MAEFREVPPEQLAEILEEHRKWVESGGKKGKKANLSSANLKNADLSGANLKNADLSKTNLQGAVLFRANLHGANLSSANLQRAVPFKANLQKADLSEADLQGAVLTKADLQGANLGSANLKNADLTEANLQGAVLIEANLQGTHLTRAILREANLQDADLSDVTRLLGGQLAGANMSGAKLTEAVSKFEALGHVEETSRNASKIFFAMLLGCVYSWLTIATTTDARLLTNAASSPLPIIQTEIPIVGFYWAAPVILLSLYFYLHLYLLRLWRGLSILPAVFPDGRALDERAYPWLLNGLARAHFRRLKDHRPPLSRLENFISILLAWWVVPATLLLFWARYLPRHDWVGTALHVGLIAVSAGFCVLSQRLARMTLRCKERKQYLWKKALNDVRTYKRTALASVILGLCVVFYLLSLGAIDGVPYRFTLHTHTLSIPLRLGFDLVLKVPSDGIRSVQRWVPRAFKLIHYSPFADLAEEDVSTKPTNWTGRQEEIQLVRGALLKDRDLRYSNATGAFLVKADLRMANLQGANLFQADLRMANLHGADLNGADLRGTILTGAVGLSQEQINQACVDEGTKLPDDLERPERPACYYINQGRLPGGDGHFLRLLRLRWPRLFLSK